MERAWRDELYKLVAGRTIDHEGVGATTNMMSPNRFAKHSLARNDGCARSDANSPSYYASLAHLCEEKKLEHDPAISHNWIVKCEIADAARC